MYRGTQTIKIVFKITKVTGGGIKTMEVETANRVVVVTEGISNRMVMEEVVE